MRAAVAWLCLAPALAACQPGSGEGFTFGGRLGASGAAGGATDGSDGAPGGSEFGAAVIESQTLLLSEADDLITGESRSDSDPLDLVRPSIRYANEVIHRAFDNVRTVATQGAVTRWMDYRREFTLTHEGLGWRLYLVKEPEEPVFRYGLHVRNPSGRFEHFNAVLRGALRRTEDGRGSGWMTANFTLLQKVFENDFAWSGQAEFRFSNRPGGLVMGYGLNSMVTPTIPQPSRVVEQFAALPGGRRVYRYMTELQMGGGTAFEQAGVSVQWIRGGGGRLDGVVRDGDIPEGHGQVRLELCWDADAQWTRVDAQPDLPAGFLTESGTDCPEGFTERWERG